MFQNDYGDILVIQLLYSIVNSFKSQLISVYIIIYVHTTYILLFHGIISTDNRSARKLSIFNNVTLYINFKCNKNKHNKQELKVKSQLFPVFLSVCLIDC